MSLSIFSLCLILRSLKNDHLLTRLKRPKRKIASPLTRDDSTKFRYRCLDPGSGDLEILIILGGDEP